MARGLGNQIQGAWRNQKCDRVFVKDAGCRELLRQFCSDKLDRESMDRLRVLLPKHQPALLPFMEEVVEQGQITCPHAIKRLLLALVSNAPVCALIPNNPELHRVIQRIVRGDNISQSASNMKVLHLHCPLLHQVYIQGLNSSFLPVLECAIAISQKTFERGVSHKLPTAHVERNAVSSFPSNPKVVERGTYAMDQEKSTPGACTKGTAKRKKQMALTKGLFTLSCPHGVFQYNEIILISTPSVPDVAPSTVVYDNACRLHMYCLNRDPVFFQETKFVVDLLHWGNHSGCSEGYSISMYPSMKRLNSQVAEQRNSSLVKLKSMVSYMTMDNFLMHVDFFIWFRNQLAKSEMPNSVFNNKALFVKLASIYTLQHR